MHEQPLLEEPTRLSQSVLWELQRDFYEHMGPEAWASALVPAAVSTNPRLAYNYAQVIVGFVRDCHAGGHLDASEPIHVIELGAGHGRLGYLLCGALRRLRPTLPEDCPPIVVISTDYAESNLEFMAEHPFLAQERDDGFHDTARLDLMALQPLQCASGRIVGPGTKNPVIVIANYIFDSLRTDIHKVSGDDLSEIWVAARKPTHEGTLHGLKVDQHEVPSLGYQDPLLQQVLEAHRGLNTAFWFPRDCIELVRWIDGWNQGPTLTLLGDKQYRLAKELDDVKKVGLVTHGSFSVTVNTFALTVAVEALGGFALHEVGAEITFSVSALLTSADRHAFGTTRLAYAGTMQDLGPRPAHRLAWAFTGEEELDTSVRLDLVLASGCDPEVFYRHAGAMTRQLDAAPDRYLRDRLELITNRTADNVYPMAPNFRILYRLAATMEFLGHDEVAEGWFRLSLAFEGEEPQTWYRIGACLLGRDRDQAIKAFENALELMPGWELAEEQLKALAAVE